MWGFGKEIIWRDFDDLIFFEEGGNVAGLSRRVTGKINDGFWRDF